MRKKETGAKESPSVKCNALWKTKDSFNCYLTPSQAITLARNILQKAQQIIDGETRKTAVHLRSVGAETERLSCGLEDARKGDRRKKPKSQGGPRG